MVVTGSLCPVCGQFVANGFTHEKCLTVQEQIWALRKQTKDLTRELEALGTEIERALARVKG